MESQNIEKSVGAGRPTTVPSASFSVTPAAPLGVHGEKPKKFHGPDFKRWQQKMLFYLTRLNLARFLHEDAPVLNENETDKQSEAALDAWKHANFLCKNYILNGLDNTLYNVYSPIKFAKELWASLEKKYKAEDVGIKKFVVGRFLVFKMLDSKTVISQVQSLQLILHEIHAEGMMLSESFQVAGMIEKLPPSWKEFKNYLKHKHKEMGLDDLITRLRIVEDNRGLEKKTVDYSMESKANVVKQAHTKKMKRVDQGQRSKENTNKKFKGNCFVCDKPEHRVKDCQSKRNELRNFKKKRAQANVTEVENLTTNINEMNLPIRA